MKTVYALLLAFVLISSTANAKDTYVHGYYRNNGTYVQPHHRSAPDNNVWNNYSTQGNVNPYTGKAGTVNPYSNSNSSYSNFNSGWGSNSNTDSSTGWGY